MTGHKQMENIKILYILGAGSSGSTLFTNLLAARIKDSVSAGELDKADHYIVYNGTCSCGANVKNCPVWGSLASDEQFRNNYPVTPYFNSLDIAAKGTKALAENRDFGGLLASNKYLYSYIAETTGSSVIIDSSKNNNRYYFLAISKKFEIYPIFIVRSMQSYIASMGKRNMSPFRAAFRWIRMNSAAYIAFKRTRGGRTGMKFSYSKMIKSHHELIEALAEKAGLELADIKQPLIHNIAGSPQRFNMGEINTNYSKVSLTPVQKLAYAVSLGFLWNRFFNV